MRHYTIRMQGLGGNIDREFIHHIAVNEPDNECLQAFIRCADRMKDGKLYNTPVNQYASFKMTSDSDGTTSEIYHPERHELYEALSDLRKFQLNDEKANFQRCLGVLKRYIQTSEFKDVTKRVFKRWWNFENINIRCDITLVDGSKVNFLSSPVFDDYVNGFVAHDTGTNSHKYVPGEFNRIEKNPQFLMFLGTMVYHRRRVVGILEALIKGKEIEFSDVDWSGPIVPWRNDLWCHRFSNK